MSDTAALPGCHRVAVVAACAFPSRRGSQVLVRAVVEHLAAVGHRVHLVTYAGAGRYVPPPGVRVHTPSPRFGYPVEGLSWKKPLHDLLLLDVLRRVVARERIEIVHAHNYEAPLIAYWVRRWRRVPVLYHAHNALADELATYARPGWRRGVATWIGRRLDEHIPRRADHAIALTPELARFLVHCGVAESRLSVVPPVGPPGEGCADTIRPAGDNARTPGAFVVAYAGNLDPYQDLDVLVEAVTRLRLTCPEAVLELVTHEPRWESRLGPRFAALVTERGARVVVAPDYETVRARLGAADALVCPRSSWSGFPIKLINYARAGGPIIVAAAAAKGLIDEASALVVPDRDPGALAAALWRLRSEPALANRLREGARRFAVAMEEGAEFASKLGAIYGKIVGDSAELDERGRPRFARLRGRGGERISSLSPHGGPR